MRLHARLWWLLMKRVVNARKPDVVIGGDADPYLFRWHLIPRNRWFNIYLHRFLRSDDDRALHDHPWWNVSYLLDGSYTEHTIAPGGVHERVIRRAGDIKLRRAKAAHRIELQAGPCRPLFVTGPRLRTWGFHCPQGWRPWQKFTSGPHGETVGSGCGDSDDNKGS